MTWVPFGWHIKDPSLWKDWHESQVQEDSDESPHAGLLEPDDDWSRVHSASITDDDGDKKHKDKGRFAAEADKSQQKPVSPFGAGNYKDYYESQKKPTSDKEAKAVRGK